ncbi:MAG: hypothetical protein JXA30_03360 [Deltaproteobacteria bacterium]|nr:hypothetical protein [Deltaproteobacteria bacterium]
MRKLGVNWINDTPALSFSARDFVNEFVRKRLQSGLPQNLAIRTYAYPEKGGSPAAIAVRSCRVIYDLWEETYHVQIKSEKRSSYHTLKRFDTVKRACLVYQKETIGKAVNYQRLQNQLIYFAVIVELNAISDDTVERIRRWLARSEEGSKITSGAFFGSFVSIFVNRRIGSAERILRFRSPLHRVP